jgi:hypothetical protein
VERRLREPRVIGEGLAVFKRASDELTDLLPDGTVSQIDWVDRNPE